MARLYTNLNFKPRFLSPRRNIQGDANGKKPDPESQPLADTSSTTQLPTINVVLFGETGVGKSSVINLIAQSDIAEVSSNVEGCTMQSTRYNISFDDLNFAIFDTIGLEEPQYGVNGYLKAIERAYELIMKLSAAGGIHLLLFCMRGGRITATTQSNYRLFCECLCSTKVPIALVFTGLEREEEMEDWWTRNKNHIEHYGIKSDGHACITAVRDDTPGEDLKFTESQKKIRGLLKDCALKDDAFMLEVESWFAKLGKGMRSFIAKHRSPKKKDVLKVLTQRCKLDPDTAKKIAEMMEKGDPETKDGSGTIAANPSTDRVQGEDGVKKEEEKDGPPPHKPANPATDGVQGEGGVKKEEEKDDPPPHEPANPFTDVVQGEDGVKEGEEKDGPPLHEPGDPPEESKDAKKPATVAGSRDNKRKKVGPLPNPPPNPAHSAPQAKMHGAYQQHMNTTSRKNAGHPQLVTSRS